MRFVTVAALASVAAVRAVDIPVTVGDNGNLAFNPNSVTANVGDTVTFEFHPKNHSVVQSTFADPCQISTGGVFSGFLPVSENATTFSTWQITIDSTAKPLWFFCAQTIPAVHCHSGMVFAVNPSANATFEQFQVNANTSQLTFTDAGQLAASSALAAAATANTAAANTAAAAQTTGTAAAANTAAANTAPANTVAGATGAAPAGVAAATSSGAVATNAIPSPAPSGTNVGAAGGASTTPGAPAPGSGAIRITSGVSGTLALAAMVALLL